MRRDILLIVACLSIFSAIYATAQGVKIYQKDGQIIDIPYANLDSIVTYKNQNNSEGNTDELNSSLIIGFWKKRGDLEIIDVYKADGTYIYYNFSHGFAEVDIWSLSGNKLCLYGDEFYQITELTKDKMSYYYLESGKAHVFDRISESQFNEIVSQYDIEYIY